MLCMPRMPNDDAQPDPQPNPQPNPRPNPRPNPGKRPKTRVVPQDAAQAIDTLEGALRQMRDCVHDATAHVAQARSELCGPSVLSAASVQRTQASLQHAASSLDALSELVHASMQSKATSLGSPLLARARPITLSEALDHAQSVLLPVARAHSITLHARCHPSIANEPARTLYTVLLNTMTNAIEAIIARGDDPSSLRTVHVELAPAPPPRASSKANSKDSSKDRDKLSLAVPQRPGQAWISLDVTDDGVGLPAHIPVARLCELGVSTKPGAGGVGLAVARSIVRGLGGELSIAARASGTRGAALRAILPAASQSIRQSA
jgi:signal transduction histidine kinase